MAEMLQLSVWEVKTTHQPYLKEANVDVLRAAVGMVGSMGNKRLQK